MTINPDDGALDGSAFWLIRSDPLVAAYVDDLMLPPGGLAVIDGSAWDKMVEQRFGRMARVGLDARRLADLATPLKLRLPDSPWKPPDFLTLGGRRFASARLRQVLSPWADLIDWVPLDLTTSEATGREADYRLMRLLAHRPAFDAEASGLVLKPDQLIAFTSRYVLRNDIADAPGLFHAEDRPSILLASDAVAERVMRSGCTGIEFRHPEDSATGDRPRRIRGPDGVILQGA